MKSAIAIAVRDFRGFFENPIGWISACIIYLLSGTVFFIVVQMLLMRGQAVDPGADIFGQILGFLNYVSIFIVPAFTMKVMSEEISQGTFRLLSMSPISTWSIVVGKFLGVSFYFAFIGFLMLLYPLYTVLFTEPDFRSLASAWLGMILNTGAIISIGIFIGSLTKNSVVSYLGAAFFIILVIFSGFIPGMPEWYKASVNLLDLSGDFTRGIIKTTSLSLYFGIILSFLFLTRFVLESKRWRA